MYCANLAGHRLWRLLLRDATVARRRVGINAAVRRHPGIQVGEGQCVSLLIKCHLLRMAVEIERGSRTSNDRLANSVKRLSQGVGPKLKKELVVAWIERRPGIL